MLEASLYIQRLKIADSLDKKKAIIREAAVDGCSELFEGFRLAYDSKRIFGVKSVPIIAGMIQFDFDQDEFEESSDTFNWAEFLELVNKLETRQLTDDEVKQALHDAAEVVCIADWNIFYRAILFKNLHCGISETAVNKVLKEIGGEALNYLTPVWKVQLAAESSKHPKRMTGKKAIDPKLDGLRLLTVLDKETGTVRMFTKDGKEDKSFASILKGLEAVLPLLPISLVLDGEIVSYSFQELMTETDKADAQVDDCYYALFDMLPLEDFERGKCPMGQMDRHEGLIELMPLLRTHTHNKTYIVPKLLVDLNTDEGKEKMAEFYEEAITAGYKSIIVKDVDGAYECRKSPTWLKWNKE